MEKLLPITLLAAAILAGCDAPPMVFPAHDETRRGVSAMFDGIRAEGTLSGADDKVSLDATARNDGSRTYKVSAGCPPPWTERLTWSGGEENHGDVNRTAPAGTCAALQLDEFKPGQEIPFQASWNGRLWDARTQRYQDAPPGNYTWRITFTVYEGGDSADEYSAEDIIRLPFTVRKLHS